MKRTIRLGRDGLIVLFTLLTVPWAIGAKAQELLAPEEYYQIAIELGRRAVDDLQARADLLRQSRDNLDAFLQQERETMLRSELETQMIYVNHGITPGEYGEYKRTHGADLEMYLNAHPEVKEELNALMRQVDELMESYEALREGIRGD